MELLYDHAWRGKLIGSSSHHTTKSEGYGTANGSFGKGR
jgi:hypothetical protein